MRKQSGRINVKLLVILFVSICLLGAGAYAAHKVRKRIIAARALQAGQDALAASDYTEASKQLRIYLGKYPNNLEILRTYADAALKVRPLEIGHVGAAIGAYRRLLRLDPEDTDAFERLVRLYLRLPNYEEALYISRQHLEEDPDDPEAMIFLSRALIGQQKFEEAATALADLIKSEQANPQAYVMLTAVMQRADSSAVTDAAARVLENRDEAGAVSTAELSLQLVNLGIERNPESAALYAQRAWLKHSVLGDAEGAREDVVAAEELQPDDPNVLLALFQEWLQLGELERAEQQLTAIEGLSAQQLAQHHVEADELRFLKFASYAALVAKKASAEEAVKLADRILQETPDYHQHKFLPMVVELYLSGGKVQEAEQHLAAYRALIEEKPDPDFNNRDLANGLEARLAAANGDFYHAIELLEELVALRRDPRNQQRLAAAYDATGQYRREARLLEQYLAGAPDDVDTGVQLARTYMKLRRWRDVARWARNAERAAPTSAGPRLLRLQAETFAEIEQSTSPRLGQLRGEVEQLAGQLPDSGAVNMLLATIAQAEERTEDAIAILTEAVENSDQPVLAALQLADLYRRSAAQDKAIQACRQAIENDPQMSAPRIMLASIQFAQDEVEEARKTLSDAVEQLQEKERSSAVYALVRYLLTQDQRTEATRMLEQLAQDDPGDLRPRLALLDLPEVQEDDTKADALIEQIKQIEGESGLNFAVEQARVQLRQDDWKENSDQLIESLNACIDRDPGWVKPVLVLGRAHELLGQTEAAEEIYRDFLDINPQRLEVSSRLLALLERQRRFDEAADILKRLPERQDFGLHRINVALGTGDYDSAIDALQKRIVSEPQDNVSQTLLARVLYAQKKDAEASLKLLDGVAENASSLSARAAILHQEGQEDEAQALMDDYVARHGDFESHFLRGEYLLFAGETELAEKDFQKLPTFPDSVVQGYAALGRFYARVGEQDEAIAAWEAGLREAPEDANLQLALVNALMSETEESSQKRVDALMANLLEQHPTEPAVLFADARIRLSKGDAESLEQARESLKQVVRKSPRSVDAHLMLVQLAGMGRDFTEAREILTRALGANPGDSRLLLAQAGLESDLGNLSAARQMARAALERDPASLRAHHLLISIALRERQFESARVLAEKALEIEPDDETSHVLFAQTLTSLGEDQEAVATLEQYCAGENGRASVAAHAALADLYINRKNPAKAEAIIETIQKLADDELTTLPLSLRLFAIQKQFDKIVARLSAAPEDDPAWTPSLLLGASLLASSGESEQLQNAADLFERATELSPDSVQGFVGLGKVRYMVGDMDAARTAYERALEVDRYSLDALNDLAWILGEEMDKPDQGLSYANRGVERYPLDPSLLDTRGVLLTRLERYDEARRDLERCLRTERLPVFTRANALFHLGRVFSLQGDSESAKSHLEQALELHEQHDIFKPEHVAEITRLLDSRVSLDKSR